MLVTPGPYTYWCARAAYTPVPAGPPSDVDVAAARLPGHRVLGSGQDPDMAAARPVAPQKILRPEAGSPAAPRTLAPAHRWGYPALDRRQNIRPFTPVIPTVRLAPQTPFKVQAAA